jgi:hypothetical protein
MEHKKFAKVKKKDKKKHTSDDIAITNAINSKPSSMWRMFFTFDTAMSRLDNVNTTSAGF